MRAEANGNGFPLLLIDRYSHGVLYVWTMPDNFTDLYALPPEVTGAIKNYVMRGFPVRLDGPAQVALFPYDNGTYIVENFSATAADVKISTLGDSTKLKELLTHETLSGKPPPPHGWNWQSETREDRVSFCAHLPPHSYAAWCGGAHGTASTSANSSRNFNVNRRNSIKGTMARLTGLALWPRGVFRATDVGRRQQ